ncbi:hypothetical protein [Nocardiopsis xinjiangensis]|uniref:hypothetical protein n=1 Tax=Nocardiopsis xinjiangensis TaxID=124285 RepID=UPI00036FB3A8|nr:hypothetical protein [Nocardiopsis xinjiangensis]
MSSTRIGAGLVAAAVVVAAVLHPVAGGWVWVPGLLLLTAAVVVLLLGLTDTETPDPPREEPFVTGPPAETDAPPPTVPNTTRLRETRLVSADPDYTFVLKGTVRWHWTGEPRPLLRAPEAQAKQAIVSAARETLAAHGPYEADLTLHALAARLGRSELAGGGTMEVWAEELDLALCDEDREHLDALARVRKERGKWEAERDVEQAKRRYFAEDALSSPGHAVIWELARNGSDIDRAEGRIDTLARLAEAGKGESLTDLRDRLHVWEPDLASALGALGDDAPPAAAAPAGEQPPQEPLDILAAAVELIEDDHQRIAFANRLAVVVEQSPRAHLAPGLRKRFGIPAWAAPDTDAHEEGGQEPVEDTAPEEEPDGAGRGPGPSGGAPFAVDGEGEAAPPQDTHPASANGYRHPGDGA